MTDPNVSVRSVLLRGGLLALFIMIVPSEAVAAQEVRGTVSEAATGEPIASVQVWLKNAEGEDLRLTFTAEDGSFLIEPDSAGVYRLEARRQGYETTISEAFSWPEDSDPIELRMSVRPVEIDGIEIEA